MVTQQLILSKIAVADSLFEALYCEAEKQQLAFLKDSLATLGQLSPLLVHPVAGKYLLLDGYKRIQCARSLTLKTLECSLVEDKLQALGLLINQQRLFLPCSAARIARFVACAKQLGISSEKEWRHLFQQMTIDFHPRVLKKYLTVAALPEEVLRFCEEKNFSLKQCNHLSKHPKALLEAVMSYRHQFNFTASILEEILQNFKDILRAEGIAFETLLAETPLQAVLSLRTNPQEKTRALRQWLHCRRYPRLSKIQSQLAETEKQMTLPQGVSLQWDHSLENRKLTFTLIIEEPEQWSAALKALSEEQNERAIEAFFEVL